jgi:rhodanese-related sulfurtransferase
MAAKATRLGRRPRGPKLAHDQHHHREELQAAIIDGDVIVVETLGPQRYEDAHIPGAINIPHTEVARLAPRLLPDKAAAIVTSCSNIACRNPRGRRRAAALARLRRRAQVREGKQDWHEAGVPLASGTPVSA